MDPKHVIDLIKEHVKLGSLDLDAEVDALKLLEAEEINNKGEDAQIEFIKERCGESHLRKLVGK